MPRKTLDKRKECGRLFATARKKAPWGCDAWRYCLTTTFLRGSCQEYRGINSRLYLAVIYEFLLRFQISLYPVFDGLYKQISAFYGKKKSPDFRQD